MLSMPYSDNLICVIKHVIMNISIKIWDLIHMIKHATFLYSYSLVKHASKYLFCYHITCMGVRNMYGGSIWQCPHYSVFGSKSAISGGSTTLFCFWQHDCIIWWLDHIIGVLLDWWVMGNSYWCVAKLGRISFFNFALFFEKCCIDIVITHFVIFDSVIK